MGLFTNIHRKTEIRKKNKFRGLISFTWEFRKISKVKQTKAQLQEVVTRNIHIFTFSPRVR